VTINSVQTDLRLNPDCKSIERRLQTMLTVLTQTPPPLVRGKREEGLTAYDLQLKRSVAPQPTRAMQDVVA
jgi:hypothetical protein